MNDVTRQTGIPEEGVPAEEVLRDLDKLSTQDIPWEEGRAWSLVYHAGKAHDDLLKAASARYFSSNYLNPFAFASLKQMEREVVQMTREMLHGGPEVVGAMTSGGTESLLLALYTYREWARTNRPAVQTPEIVTPATIHPAHDKAAHYFGVRIRKANVDKGQRAVASEMEKLINRNTILLCASAPSYPHGILDPIKEIASLAGKHQLPMHVDSCIGGFMLPWVEKLGYPVDPWDFRVPGVTSISADVHKFGYGAKGASVLLYSDMAYMRNQFFISTDFPGGIYASATLLGTRAGSAIAAAWAGIRHMGKNGYLDVAATIMDGREKMKRLLAEIPEVRIIGEPCMNIIAYTTKKNSPDLFAVGHFMEKKGWLVDRQQLPDSIHLTLLPTNVGVIDQYITDLKQAIQYCRSNPDAAGKGNAALYGMMARVPLRGIVRNNVLAIFEQMYGSSGGSDPDMPEEQIAAVKPWMKWLSRLLALFKKV